MKIEWSKLSPEERDRVVCEALGIVPAFERLDFCEAICIAAIRAATNHEVEL